MVKPLKWLENRGVHVARTVKSYYQIWFSRGVWKMSRADDDNLPQRFNTLEEAKDAAETEHREMLSDWIS